MKVNGTTRIWALALAVFISVGAASVPVQADADTPQSDHTILSFVPLDDEIKNQAYALGTSTVDMELPDELTANFSDGLGGSTENTVPVEAWKSTPAFDEQIANTYLFKPTFDSQWDIRTSAIPEITVKLGDAQPESGTFSRQITLMRPEINSKYLGIATFASSTVNGDALAASFPYAKVLYDHLAVIQVNDIEPKTVEFATETAPKATLPLGYSPENIEAAVEALIVDDITSTVAQPAMEAFWKDNPDADWLSDTATVEVEYTVENGELVVSKANFVFGYAILRQGPNEVELILAGVSYGPMLFTKALEEIRKYTGTTDISDTSITLLDDVVYSITSGTAANPLALTDKPCSITGASGASSTYSLTIITSARLEVMTLNLTVPTAFENIALKAVSTFNVPNAEFGFAINTDEDLYLDNVCTISTDAVITLKGKNNGFNTLYLKDVSSINYFTGFNTTEISGDVETKGTTPNATTNLIIKAGASLIIPVPVETNSLQSTSGTIKYSGLQNSGSLIIKLVKNAGDPDPVLTYDPEDFDPDAPYGRLTLVNISENSSGTIIDYAPMNPVINSPAPPPLSDPLIFEYIKLVDFSQDFNDLYSLKYKGSNYVISMDALQVSYRGDPAYTWQEENWIAAMARVKAINDDTAMPIGSVNDVTVGLRTHVLISGASNESNFPDVPFTVNTDSLFFDAAGNLTLVRETARTFDFINDIRFENVMLVAGDINPSGNVIGIPAVNLNTAHNVTLATGADLQKVTIMQTGTNSHLIVDKFADSTDTAALIAAATGSAKLESKPNGQLISNGQIKTTDIELGENSSVSATTFPSTSTPPTGAIVLHKKSTLAVASGSIQSATMTLNESSVMSAGVNVVANGAITLENLATLTAATGTVNATTLTLNPSSTVTSAGLVTASASMNIGAGSTLTAPTIAVTNGLTLGNNATLELTANTTSNVGTLNVNGDTTNSTLKYSGPARTIFPLLNMTSNANVTITYGLTLAVADATDFTDGKNVFDVEKPGIISDDTLRKITLSGFTRKTLIADPLNSTYQNTNQYIIATIKVYVSGTHTGPGQSVTDVPFTSFPDAVAYINTGMESHDNIKMDLVADVTTDTEDASTGMPIRDVTINGNDGTFTYTLESTKPAFYINKNVTFKDINLKTSVNNWDFYAHTKDTSATGYTLTLGDGITFTGRLNNIIGVVNATPNNSSNLELLGSSFTLGGKIDNVYNLTFGTSTELEVQRIKAVGTITAAANGNNVIFTQNGDTALGNLYCPTALDGTIIIENLTLPYPAPGHHFLQLEKGSAISPIAISNILSNIVRPNGSKYEGLSFRPYYSDLTYDYYNLTAVVDDIVITANGSNPLTVPYNSSITLEASIRSKGNPSYDRAGEVVKFYLGTGNSKVLIDPDPTAIGAANKDGAVLGEGTTGDKAVFNLSQIIRLNAGNNIISVIYTNPYDATEEVIKEITITITPLSITAAYTLDGANTKIYSAVNGRPYDSTKTATLSSGSIADMISFTPSILTGDNVTISAGTLQFTNKNVEAQKRVEIVDLVLAGAASGNYVLSNTSLSATNVSAKIIPKEITPVVTVDGRDYDGTKDVPITVLLLSSGILGDPALGGAIGGDLNIITITPNLAYETKDAGTGKTTTKDNPLNPAWAIFASDSTLNYVIADAALLQASFPTGTVDKKAVALDVSGSIFPSGITREYDGTNDIAIDNAAKARINTAGLVASEVSLADKVTFTSAYFDSPNVGTGKKCYVTFALDSSPEWKNYMLAASSYEFSTTGEITKKKVGTVADLVIQLPYNDAMSGEILNLNEIELPPGNPMLTSGDNKLFTRVSVTGNETAFFGTSLTINGDKLHYDYTGLPASGDVLTLRVNIETDNYILLSPAKIIFEVVNKDRVTISGVTMASPRVYNNGVVQPDISNMKIYRFGTNAEVTNIDKSSLIYKYVSATSVSDQAPKDVEDYILTISIPADNTAYMGSSAPISFEISKRPLTIKPKNMEVTLGDPLPAWGVTEYEALPQAGSNDDNGLAQGETLLGVGATMVPPLATVSVNGGLSTNVVGNFDVTIAQPSPPLTSRNYQISTVKGTLTVKDKQAEGHVDFHPIDPDGLNGWYTQDIVIASNDSLFSFISSSPSGTFGSSIILNEPTSPAGKDVAIYLSTAANGGLVSSVYNYTYLLDKTDPSIVPLPFQQNRNGLSGTINVVITDEHSGVNPAEVKIQAPNGGEVLLMVKGTGDNYSFNITQPGLYTITVKDIAGRSSTIPYSAVYREVKDFEIRKDGKRVTLVETNIRDTDGGKFALTAQVTDGDAKPGVDFDFVWSSSSPNIAEVDANGNVTPLSVGEVIIKASAMGIERYVTVQVSTTVDINVPPSILPPGVKPNDVILLITPLEAGKRARMINDIVAINGEYLQSFLTGEWRTESSQWLEIRLVYKHDHSIDVPFTGSLTVPLSYPAGTNGSDNVFVLAHRTKSDSLEFKMLRHGNTITFTATSLSPFGLVWRDKLPSDNDGSSDYDAGDSGRGSGGSSSGAGKGGSTGSWNLNTSIGDGFWQKVVDSIRNANDEDRINAYPPINVTDCPRTVLDALAGKDVTLVITWAGEPIIINGKNILPPPDNISYYTLANLAEMYGLATSSPGVTMEDLQNPTTGGDDYNIIAPNAAIKPPNVSDLAPSVTHPGVPGATAPAVDASGSAATVMGNEGIVAANDSTGSTFVLGVAILLILLAGILFLRRQQTMTTSTQAPGANVAQVTPAPPAPVIIAIPAMDVNAVEAPVTPKATPAVAQPPVSQQVPAAPQAKPPVAQAPIAKPASPQARPVAAQTTAAARPAAPQAKPPVAQTPIAKPAAPQARPVAAQTTAAARPAAPQAKPPVAQAPIAKPAAPQTRPVAAQTTAAARPAAPQAKPPVTQAPIAKPLAPQARPIAAQTTAAARPAAPQAKPPVTQAPIAKPAAPQARPVAAQQRPAANPANTQQPTVSRPARIPAAATASMAPSPGATAQAESFARQTSIAANSPQPKAKNDSSFLNVISGHKELQKQLQSGHITKEEYEKKKRILLMYS